MTTGDDTIVVSVLTQLRQDPHGFHTRIRDASDDTAAVVVFCRFLDVYPSLRRRLTFENLYTIMKRILETIRIDIDHVMIYHCTQLIQETFLSQQLQQRRHQKKENDLKAKVQLP